MNLPALWYLKMTILSRKEFCILLCGNKMGGVFINSDCNKKYLVDGRRRQQEAGGS
jgi:hypothetical protein